MQTRGNDRDARLVLGGGGTFKAGLHCLSNIAQRAGADLLVTDQSCNKAWSVQVKTNSGKATYWLMGAHAKRMNSESHMYVFVNNANGEKPEFIVAPSNYVSKKIGSEVSPKGNEWSWFAASDRLSENEGWEQFGNPRPNPVIAAALQVESQTEASPCPSLE